MTKRTKDGNGFVTISDNPISKVGVFPYKRSTVEPNCPPHQANDVIMVMRPEKELNNKETIESFKLKPWIEDHTMLGDGETSTDQVRISGVTGEQVYFEYPELRANLQLFSDDLEGKIDTNKKKDLSIGYRCKFVPEVGNFEGKSYTYVQKEIRGNHLASVGMGRSGKDVSVQDTSENIFINVVDHFDIQCNNKINSEQSEMTLDVNKLAEMLKKPTFAQKLQAAMDEAEKESKDEDKEKDAKDETEEEKKKREEKEAKDKKAKDEDKEKAEDLDDKSACDSISRSELEAQLARLQQENRTAMDAAIALDRKNTEEKYAMAAEVRSRAGVIDPTSCADAADVAQKALTNMGYAGKTSDPVGVFRAMASIKPQSQTQSKTALDSADAPKPAFFELMGK